jgi:hypothetical protein
MDVNREKVETLGRMFREFYENVVNHNINQNEWDEFIDNKTKWFTTLQYPNKTFEMDEKGSRWVDPVETPEQDVDWDRYTRELNRELDDIIIDWITCNGETGWEKMLEFLNNKKQEFIRDIKVYYQYHRSEDCVEESEYDDYYEEVLEVLDSPVVDEEDDEMEGLMLDDDEDDELESVNTEEDKKQKNNELVDIIEEFERELDDDSDVSVEEIMNQLRQEVEEVERNFVNGEPL